MSHPILVTGAAGGMQGSTGRRVASLLIEQGIPVRALVHTLDSRSDVGETPTVKQVTEALARAIGRPIRYLAITDDEWADAVRERIKSSRARSSDTSLAVLPPKRAKHPA